MAVLLLSRLKKVGSNLLVLQIPKFNPLSRGCIFIQRGRQRVGSRRGLYLGESALKH